jgi:hypothetical protein
MVRITLTEKSYRKEFIIKLNEALQSNNLVIYDDSSVSFIDSENNRQKTRFPDIIIAEKSKVHQEGDIVSISKDGVIAVIETKKASKNVYAGVSQALDYMNILNTKHSFATNFKDIVGFQIIDGKPKVDERLNSKLTESAVSSVIDFIIDILIRKKELQPVELNDDLIVKILEGSVSEMLNYMKVVGSEKLEEPLGFFFAKKLDTKILESTKSKKEFASAIRKAGAYLIVNQILFYHILSVEETSKYQKFKKIIKLSDLQKYFDRVLEDDYKSIFGVKVSSFLTEDSVEAVNSIVGAVKALRLERVKHDILGKIFHGLIPKDLRKRIAAYYTSNAAGELLANLCIKDKDAKVLDPACGSGTLLVSCYRKKRELYDEDTKNIHRTLLSQIIGGDISIFAAHLAAIHLALQEPLSYTDEVHVVLGDFFEISPKKKMIDWLNQSKLMKKVSAEDIKEAEFTIPLVDLVIMNPPFTRMEIMDKDYKDFIEKSFATSPNKEYLQRRMGLHGAFLLHADDYLKMNGQIAAVLPASTFYTGYGEKLEKFLLSKYKIKYIIASDVETTFSEQSTFKEILFVAEKTAEKRFKYDTAFIVLKVPLTLKNSGVIADKIKKIKSEKYEDTDMRVRIVSKEKLLEEKNWMSFIEESNKNYDMIESAKNIIVANKYLDNRISEGIRRFPTDFFVLPNKLWKIIEEDKTKLTIEHIQTKEKLNVPNKFLIKAIRKPELYNTIGLKPSHYIIVINPYEKLNEDMRRYLNLGEKLGMDKVSKTLMRETQKRRIPWYSYTYLISKNPNIFGKVFLIYKLRFNTAKITAHYVSDNITAGGMFLIIKPKTDEDAKILALWYNSTIYTLLLLTKGRAIQSSYYEALMKDIKKLPLIDISKLDIQTKRNLVNLFDKYSSIKLPPFPKQIEQNVKEEMDLAILKALEVNNPEKALKLIYKNVYDKIKTLSSEINR